MIDCLNCEHKTDCFPFSLNGNHFYKEECEGYEPTESEQEKYDRQWDEEYEAYLSSMREEYKEEYETNV